MEAIVSKHIVDPLVDFGKSSIALINKCNKPDRKGIKSNFENS